jgi:hypothetical protein
MYKRDIEARSNNIYCLGKAVSITCSKCVSLTLVIHNEKSIHHTVLQSAACPDLPDFTTLSHKRNDFRENVIKYKIRFDFL